MPDRTLSLLLIDDTPAFELASFEPISLQIEMIQTKKAQPEMRSNWANQERLKGGGINALNTIWGSIILFQIGALKDIFHHYLGR